MASTLTPQEPRCTCSQSPPFYHPKNNEDFQGLPCLCELQHQKGQL